MEWDHIAKGWKQLIAKIIPPRNAKWDTTSPAQKSPSATSFDDKRYGFEPPPPHIPDRSRERSHFSQHSNS